jgi:multiple antibiotic resistance protein
VRAGGTAAMVTDVAESAGLVHFGLTAFLTLFVVVDPIGVTPLVVALVEPMDAAERLGTIRRSVAVAGGLAAFFLVAGRALLAYLGVTVPAFAISGGILLFVTALPMLFGQRPRLQAPERGERATHGEDPAIFPLAIPLLSGPGTITTILLLTSRADRDVARLAVVGIAMAAVYLLSFLVLVSGERLVSALGEGKVHVITRVMGIVLAAVAVQYVLNGVGDYWASLAHDARSGSGRARFDARIGGLHLPGVALRPSASAARGPRQHEAERQHALATSLGLEVPNPRFEQVGERDHADEPLAVRALDDGEPGEPGLRHPVRDHAKRLVGMRDDEMPSDDAVEAAVAVLDDAPDVAAAGHADEPAIAPDDGIERLAASGPIDAKEPAEILA